MICMLIGFALTLITRFLLVALKLNPWLRPAPIVYPCLMMIFTVAVWIAFFQN
jgi:hypothetical protein